MSFTVNGQTWVPQTAATHAQMQLTYLNALNVAPTLVASPTNAIWLNYLGSGSIQQTYDDKLYAASQSFNVATCDDNQVLNLAPITGTAPMAATYSTVYLDVTAAAAGNATVPAGTLAPFNGYSFSVGTTTVVPAGTTVSIFCTCTTPGPILVLSGQITSFATSITNVQTVNNPANSTQGNDTETITAFRQRLIAGNGTVNWDLNGTISAIRALPGVISANVFFNPDTVNTLALPGGLTVPPRYSRIIIQGSDVTGALAKTYANRMTAPTVGGTTASPPYVTSSGQTIPIYYDTATNQNVYVIVYYNPSLPFTGWYDTLVKNTIVALNSTLNVGQAVNSEMILSALNNFAYATITGATVSIDNITYGRNAVVNANQVGYFTTANIQVLSGP